MASSMYALRCDATPAWLRLTSNDVPQVRFSRSNHRLHRRRWASLSTCANCEGRSKRTRSHNRAASFRVQLPYLKWGLSEGARCSEYHGRLPRAWASCRIRTNTSRQPANLKSPGKWTANCLPGKSPENHGGNVCVRRGFTFNQTIVERVARE
jgi:hypothetical protein